MDFTALSPFGSKQHFDIFVKKYDPDVVPIFGKPQNATLDNGTQTEVWSCMKFIEEAVQTKCQYGKEVFLVHFIIC